jgi:hypothetical protein
MSFDTYKLKELPNDDLLLTNVLKIIDIKLIILHLQLNYYLIVDFLIIFSYHFINISFI